MTEARLSQWDGREVAALRRAWDVPVLEAHGTLGSTNDRARALAEAGGIPWTTVVADEQSHGRGRRGTSWISAPGSGLWMSLIVDADAGATTMPLKVGVACAEAIEAVAPGVDVGIKWPNDLLITGADQGAGGANVGVDAAGVGVDVAKVGGVLCESAGTRVVVGIGINVSDAPDGSAVAASKGLPPVSLEAVGGKTLSRSVLAAAIIARLKERLRAGTPAAGLDEDTLRELDRRDVLKARAVMTDQAGAGEGAGIDATGAFLLKGPDGELRVVSGGVRFVVPGVPGRGPA